MWRRKAVHQRPEEKPPGGTRCCLEGAEAAIKTGVGATGAEAGVETVEEADEEPFTAASALSPFVVAWGASAQEIRFGELIQGF